MTHEHAGVVNLGGDVDVSRKKYLGGDVDISRKKYLGGDVDISRKQHFLAPQQYFEGKIPRQTTKEY